MKASRSHRNSCPFALRSFAQTAILRGEDTATKNAPSSIRGPRHDSDHRDAGWHRVQTRAEAETGMKTVKVCTN